MFLLTIAFLIVLNTSLLFFAVSSLGFLFAVYFLFTQGILSWFFIDQVVTRGGQQGLALAANPVQMKTLPAAASADKKADTFEKIDFEITQDIDFEGYDSPTLVANSLSDKVEIIEKTFKDRNRSQLEIIDGLVKERKNKKKSLLIANLYTLSENSEKLEDYLFDRAFESDILCKEIYPKIDLIPHIGEIRNIPDDILLSFVKDKASQYEKVIFYLYPNEAEKVSGLVFSQSLEHTSQVIADLQL